MIKSSQADDFLLNPAIKSHHYSDLMSPVVSFTTCLSTAYKVNVVVTETYLKNCPCMCVLISLDVCIIMYCSVWLRFLSDRWNDTLSCMLCINRVWMRCFSLLYGCSLVSLQIWFKLILHSQSVSQSVSKSVNHLISWSINQSFYQLVNQLINQSVGWLIFSPSLCCMSTCTFYKIMQQVKLDYIGQAAH